MTGIGSYIWGSIRRGTFWPSTARWLRTHHFFFPMSWQAYAFDRYRRQRSRLFQNHNFSRVAFPGIRELVSIVLPAYNGEDYLRESIESILAQTYPHWELIAVDDGSTDQTGRILDEYARQDARIRVIHQENRRLPGALNAGFALARGEYLTWTSCDNCLKADFLEKLTASLKRHPEWDMVYANIDLIDEHGHPLKDSREFIAYQRPFGSDHIYLPTDTGELNVFPNNFINAAFLYRNRVPGLLGEYSLQRFTLEDYDYWMRINALMCLRHVDFQQPVYEYRFHERSLTGRRAELKIHENRAALMIFDDFRRSFYLQPILWILEDLSEIPSNLAGDLGERIAAAGHLLLSPEQVSHLSLPRLGIPVVYIQFGEAISNLRFPAPGLPAHSIKVLVTSQSGILGEGLDRTWDRFVTTQPNPAAPWFMVRDAHSLFLALDVFARSRALQEVEHRFLAPTAAAIKVTVVVSTYRLVDRLAVCLRSLVLQDFSPADYEVLVVNNATDPGAIDACFYAARDRWFAGREDRFRLVHCPIPGLSHARNAGLVEAQGEIVAFIDDDAEAQPDWLSTLWRAYESHPQASIIGGKILLKEPGDKPWWFRPGWKRFWSHFDPSYADFTQVDHWKDYPWGANWSARRSALYTIGGFRSSFGRKGKNLSGGEEIVAASLIQKLGGGVGIEPAAVVVHNVDPSRFTCAYVWQTIHASRRTWYEVQRNLYIPMETSLGDIFGRIRDAFKSRNSESILKVVFTLYAEMMLVVWLVKDFILRLRKPVTYR